jgi:hypothetical protein
MTYILLNSNVLLYNIEKANFLMFKKIKTCIKLPKICT